MLQALRGGGVVLRMGCLFQLLHQPLVPPPQLTDTHLWYFYRPRTYVRREVMFSQVCVCSGGGVPGLRLSGGVPGLRFSGGWRVPGLRFSGGVPGLRFWGGYLVSDFWGGVPGLRFSGGLPGLRFLGGYPVSVKGKIFDTRFGLIHVQTGKKNFC